DYRGPANRGGTQGRKSIQMKKGNPPNDVNAYLKTVPRGSRAVLERLRRTIKTAAPEAEEGISYRIPVFKYHGPLVFFAAFENHCSLFVPSKAIVASFSSELRGYHTSGATIHFTPDHPLPVSLVRKIVKAGVQANLLRVKQRKT
ncbi:MAG TPA: DUF1801 domain-containing protein, partial [Bacteroidota bacterium]